MPSGAQIRSTKSETNLKSEIAEEGIKEPLIVQIYRHGKVKVKIGEGNHRHAIAKELGIKHLPVRFLFWEGDRQ